MATAAHRNTEINRCNLQLVDVYLARNNLPVAERYYNLVAQAYEGKRDIAMQAQTWLSLMRIDNKTYGICRTTGKLIPKERLRAVPHTTQTMEAKLKQD